MSRAGTWPSLPRPALPTEGDRAASVVEKCGFPCCGSVCGWVTMLFAGLAVFLGLLHTAVDKWWPVLS
eukprot:1160139-Pelagomonas_calceolata.AAC.4